MKCHIRIINKKAAEQLRSVALVGLAPRAGLSAKLLSVLFRILNDPYEEKYTQN
jgi:hypothetical protein